MAHSPYTETVTGFVGRNPGCCKADVCRFVRRNPLRGVSKLYHIIDTQIRLGNVLAIPSNGRYALYLLADAVRLGVVDKAEWDH